jgi:hypothetical protein
MVRGQHQLDPIQKARQFARLKKSNLESLVGLDPIQKDLKRLFSKRIAYRNSRGVILVETQQPLTNEIALSKFLPGAINFYDANVVGYSMLRYRFGNRIKQWLRHRLSFLGSISKSKHLLISGPKDAPIDYSNLFDEFLRFTPTKSAFEKYHYRGILVGDLIYDLYLRNSRAMTLDFRDPDLRIRFIEVLAYFDSMRSYIQKNNVRAICVSHAVYHFAIPARLGIHFDIDVFLVTHENIYRLTHEFPQAFTDFLQYEKQLSDIKPNELEDGLKVARNRLIKRTSGEVVDMPYFTNMSPFRTGEARLPPVVESHRLRILVSLHDFFDSPHVYGFNFFPDFLEWLQFLDRISRETDYEWYLKPHPNALKDPTPELIKLFEYNKRFKILDSTTSNAEMKNFGIDFALTVYGSVGHELPFLGIKVINASLNNPHMAFNFSHTPKDLCEYENILLNLENFSYEINEEEIYQYYYLHYIYNLNSWIFSNYEKVLHDIGGYSNLFNITLPKYLASHPAMRDQELIEVAVMNFLRSDSIRLSPEHFIEAKDS